MNLAQAKRHAARYLPKLELAFRRDYRMGGACAVLLPDGTPLGVGPSWLTALRDAALRLERLAKAERADTAPIEASTEPP